MSDDLADLRAVAEAATPGWVPVPARVEINNTGTCDACATSTRLVASYDDAWLCGECAAAADYEGTFDPPTVLGLLDRLVAAEAVAQRDEAEKGRLWQHLRDRCATAETAVERVRALADEWRYKGEFGWGAWQEGHGPDQEGWALDHAAADLRAALEGDA